MASKVPGRKGDPNTRTPSNFPSSRVATKLTKATCLEYLFAMMVCCDLGTKGRLTEPQFLGIRHCTKEGLAEMLAERIVALNGDEDEYGDPVYQFTSWEDHARTPDEKEAKSEAARTANAVRWGSKPDPSRMRKGSGSDPTASQGSRSEASGPSVQEADASRPAPSGSPERSPSEVQGQPPGPEAQELSSPPTYEEWRSWPAKERVAYRKVDLETYELFKKRSQVAAGLEN